MRQRDKSRGGKKNYERRHTIDESKRERAIILVRRGSKRERAKKRAQSRERRESDAILSLFDSL